MYPNRSKQPSFLGDKLSSSALKETKTYITELRDFYKNLYNGADDKMDQKKFRLTNSANKREEYLSLKNAYHNTDLQRFITNSNHFFSNKIIEYKGELWQKVDPIFQDPESTCFKAHFLSPTKRIGHITLNTFYANALFIWLINITLFIALYYRVVPHTLTSGTRLKRRFTDYKKSR